MLSAADVASVQATLGESFAHRLVIERASDGAADDWNHPARTWSTLATVSGTVIPRTPEEAAQANDAGVVTGTHTILLLPADVGEADRIRHDRDECTVDAARDLPDLVFEIAGIRNTDASGVNLALECRTVTP